MDLLFLSGNNKITWHILIKNDFELSWLGDCRYMGVYSAPLVFFPPFRLKIVCHELLIYIWDFKISCSKFCTCYLLPAWLCVGPRDVSSMANRRSTTVVIDWLTGPLDFDRSNKLHARDICYPAGCGTSLLGIDTTNLISTSQWKEKQWILCKYCTVHSC